MSNQRLERQNRAERRRMAAAERRAIKAGVWTISSEEREQPTGRCEHLGESLLNIANQLRGVEDGADALRWVANGLSTELYKVLVQGMKGRPLLDCLTSPTMPVLDSTLLRGDAHELYPPWGWVITPENLDKVGPGFITSIAAHVYPLYGLSKINGTFWVHPPWNNNTPHLPIAEWVEQELVQLCYIRRTIRDAMKWTRDKRGSHTDKDWGDDVPHDFRPFYLMYVGIFLFHVSRYLVSQALEATRYNSDFSERVFPDVQRLDERLRVPSYAQGDFHMRLLPGEECKRKVPFEGRHRPFEISPIIYKEDPHVTTKSYLLSMSAPVDHFRIRIEQGRTTVELHRAGAPPLVINDVPSPIPPAWA